MLKQINTRIEELFTNNYQKYYRLAYSYVQSPEDAMDVVQESCLLYTSRFIGNANIIKCQRDGRAVTLAVRSENILINESDNCPYTATVLEKSFAGGMLRVVLRLQSGEEIVASRHGINIKTEVGETVHTGWNPEHAVEVEE